MLPSNVTYPENDKQQTHDFRIPRDWPIRNGALRILHKYLPKVASHPTQYVDETRPEF